MDYDLIVVGSGAGALLAAIAAHAFAGEYLNKSDSAFY